MIDYYQKLGVSRTSEDVVIRAAYLALMRRYHPDTNQSSSAAERAREITTAYEVLSDKNKRAAYDRRDFDRHESAVFEPPRRPPVGPIFFAATMLLLSLAVLVVWMKPSGSTFPSGPLIADNKAPPALLTRASCVWPNATEAISQELVRQAGKLRAVDRHALALIAPQMVVRINPALASRTSPQSGRISCNAAVQLKLPVGVTLADGRQTFGGDIAYSVLNQAGKGSPKVTYAAADEIAVQLASLRQPPPPTIDPAVEMTDAAPEVIEPAPLAKARPVPVAVPKIAARPAPVRAIVNRPAAAPPAPRTAVVIRPAPAPRQALPPAVVKTVASSPRKPKAERGCREYGTRWTELICEDKSLAALDQQLGALDAQAWSRASAEKREQLRRSRGRFSATRIQCTTDACLRQLYLGRMKVIADIMGQSQPASAKKVSN